MFVYLKTALVSKHLTNFRYLNLLSLESRSVVNSTTVLICIYHFQEVYNITGNGQINYVLYNF